MKNILPISLLCLSALAACQEDFDYDRVSTGVSFKPSLLIPSLFVDASVRYFVSEETNTIEYYTHADGTHRLRLRAEHDSSMVYSLMDIAQVHTKDVRAQGALNMALTPSVRPEAGKTMTAHKDIPLAIGHSEQFILRSLKASCTINLKVRDFGVPSVITVSVGDCTRDVAVSGSGNQVVEFETVNAPVTDDGNVMVGLTVKAQSDGKGNFGSIDYDVALSEAHSVTVSTQGCDYESGRLSFILKMADVRTLVHKGDLRDPRFYITCTNSTGMDISVMPHVNSHGYSLVMLDANRMNIPAQAVGYEYPLTKTNSNVAKFFQNVPDTISYTAEFGIAMPQGADRVTIASTDSIFVGYRYMIPLELMFDGEFNRDTIMLGDNMDAVSQARRGKLVVSAANSMPAGVNVSIQMINKARGEEYSTLVMDDLVPAPTLDAEGLSKDTVHSITNVPLNEENLDDIRRSDAIVISSSLVTADRYVVPKLEDGIKLDISLAAQFEFNNY